MSSPGGLPESAEDLYENAPCGYLSTRLDGTIVRVNRTFEEWTGLRREELLEQRRFQDLLTPGGRIYHETHYAPLLQMQGTVREIAVEIMRADGSVLPALINSVVREDRPGGPRMVRTTVFDASDRRRYERELLKARREQREIAAQLQRGLLDKTLPEIPGVELEVAYRPGGSDIEVGGDWYDAFAVEDGRVVLVVGDVVGRGMNAAAEMGQLRSAVRAFAATGMSPAGILEALDGYSMRHAVGQMATVVCAVLDLHSRELRYACAGHLPPLVVGRAERPAYLWEGRSLPVATPGSGARARPEAARTLADGTTLVLYTDGLVERRDRGFDPGMELLLARADHDRDRGAASFAMELLRALHDPAHTDDVCLLVARLEPAAEMGN